MQQNNVSEISLEFEGSEAGIVKNLRKMKVLGGVSPGRRNRPAGPKYSGKRKVWAPRALPRTLATYAPSRPSFLDPPSLVMGP